MNLNERQQAEYDRLMHAKMRDWPQALKDLWVSYQLKQDPRTAMDSAVREWVQREVK